MSQDTPQTPPSMVSTAPAEGPPFTNAARRPDGRVSPKGSTVQTRVVGGVLVVVALGLIFLGSLGLSRRHVEPDPSGVELAVDLPAEAVRISPLEQLWKEHEVRASYALLEKPLQRKSPLSEPVNLNATESSREWQPLRLELHFREKTHTMGHRDTHAVLLRIANTSDVPLAFRVDTQEGRLFVECKNIRPATAHQFMLPAGGSVERLEGCTGTPASAELVIRRIQVLELNESAVISLGRVLQPIGLSVRLRSQHKTLEVNPLPPCIVPDVEVLQNRILENPDAWFDIMDFLARHDCARERMP